MVSSQTVDYKWFFEWVIGKEIQGDLTVQFRSQLQSVLFLLWILQRVSNRNQEGIGSEVSDSADKRGENVNND